MLNRYQRLVIVALTAATTAAVRAEEPNVDAVRQGTGIRNGVAVHVGVETGTLTAGLAQSANFIVQGLTRDDAVTTKVRSATAAQVGIVSIVPWQVRTRLPYADRFVNLLVVDCDALGTE